MAYRLKLNEPIDDAVRRILGEEIDAAVHELAEGKDRVKAVHEARKALKRARALLKLVRRGLPKDVYKDENRRFRDVARLLSGTRDRDVLVATAQTLAAGRSPEARKVADAIAAAPSASATGDARSAREATADAIAGLEKARAELATMRFDKKGFGVMLKGLERTYRDGRRAMHEVLDEHHDEAFHEWRKAVQAHWRHMALLERAWPEHFEARVTLAKEISELLGEDHDLAVLIDHLRGDTGKGSATASGAHELVDAARGRQAEIRQLLRPKGEALYAEGAGEFSDRIAAYWTAAKAERRLLREMKAAQAVGATPAKASAVGKAAAKAAPKASPKAGKAATRASGGKRA